MRTAFCCPYGLSVLHLDHVHGAEPGTVFRITEHLMAFVRDVIAGEFEFGISLEEHAFFGNDFFQLPAGDPGVAAVRKDSVDLSAASLDVYICGHYSTDSMVVQSISSGWTDSVLFLFSVIE